MSVHTCLLSDFLDYIWLWRGPGGLKTKGYDSGLLCNALANWPRESRPRPGFPPIVSPALTSADYAARCLFCSSCICEKLVRSITMRKSWEGRGGCVFGARANESVMPPHLSGITPLVRTHNFHLHVCLCSYFHCWCTSLWEMVKMYARAAERGRNFIIVTFVGCWLYSKGWVERFLFSYRTFKKWFSFHSSFRAVQGWG